MVHVLRVSGEGFTVYIFRAYHITVCVFIHLGSSIYCVCFYTFRAIIYTVCVFIHLGLFYILCVFLYI
jgi:hypothetical protein